MKIYLAIYEFILTITGVRLYQFIREGVKPTTLENEVSMQLKHARHNLLTALEAQEDADCSVLKHQRRVLRLETYSQTLAAVKTATGTATGKGNRTTPTTPGQQEFDLHPGASHELL